MAAAGIGAAGAAGAVTGAAGAQRSRLRRTAEKFEGILVSRLMHEMQSARFGPDGLGGPGGSVYRGMLDTQFSNSIASRDPFGIARLLVEQLGGARPSPQASRPAPVVHAPAARAAGSTPAAAEVTPPTGELARARQFAGRVMPLLVPAAKRLGTTPRSLLAQAALETGWGRHQPRTPHGGDSHNVFGVKAGSAWQGDSASASTREHGSAGWHRTNADFRVYHDLHAAVQDFVHVAEKLVSGLRGKGVAGARGWGELMQRSGYSTDPGYASKLSAVAHGPLMRAVLGALGPAVKSGANVSLNGIPNHGNGAHEPR